MSDTSSRTLRLLSLLQTHRYWSGDALATRLDVSLRTLRRDVDRLRELGYPVRADRGVGGGYQLAPGASLPPLLLDDDEAVALAVGLRAVTHDSLTGIAEASLRALAKVTQVMPKALRRRVEALDAATVTAAWGPAPQADPEALVVLAQACRDDERITFDYVARGGAASSRRVEPARLVTIGSRWYLVGYDLDRGAWRNFRLDRLQHARSTGVRFRQRDLPGGDAAAFVRAGLGRSSGAMQVQAVLAAGADEVRGRIGRWAEVSVPETISDEGRCLVRFRVETPEWAVFALGVAGADIISVEPAEFAAVLADWADRFGAVGRDGSPVPTGDVDQL